MKFFCKNTKINCDLCKNYHSKDYLYCTECEKCYSKKTEKCKKCCFNNFHSMNVPRVYRFCKYPDICHYFTYIHHNCFKECKTIYDKHKLQCKTKRIIRYLK